MRLRVLKAGLFCLVGSLIFGAIGAQAADSISSSFLIAQADPMGLGGLEGTNSRRTTDKERLKEASDAQEEMREGLALLQKHIDEARKAKDVVYLSCLIEKYSSVKSLLKVTETASILMQEAIDRNSSQEVDLQFRKVYIARLKARKLLQEADECMYQAANVPEQEEGEVKIEVITRPIDYEDPSEPLDDPIDFGSDYFLCP